MKVRVEPQVLAPGMQDRGDADLGAESVGIGCQSQERCGRGSKQQIVEPALIVQHQRPQEVRQREDDVEVADRAVAIPARIVRDAREATASTRIDMASQGRRPALGQASHHLRLLGTHRMPVAIRFAVNAEDVRHFQGSLRMGSLRMGSLRMDNRIDGHGSAPTFLLGRCRLLG